MKKLSVYSVILGLVVAMLTNGIGISFKSEVFLHELDHARQTLSPNPEMHLEAHRDTVFIDGMELDPATHLCLHAAGQYQPFYFIRITLAPPIESLSTLATHISLFLPDSVHESLYHPPRTV